MTFIPARLRRIVVERSRNRCEYCQLSQIGQEATFHIDHIVPLSRGGQTSVENLAHACVSCSLRKADRELVEDPISQCAVQLFDPRQQRWEEHFRIDGVQIEGKTSTGRATVDALAMNRPLALGIRMEESLRGRYPPQVDATD